MTKPFLRTLLPAALVAGIAAFFAALPGMGLLLVFVVPPLLIWIPWGLWAARTEPGGITLHGARACIWIAAVALVVVIHSQRDASMRRDAEAIVASVKQYTALHGRCPQALDEIGLSRQQLEEKLGRARYWCDDGRPGLDYQSTFDATSTYIYDFSRGEWNRLD